MTSHSKPVIVIDSREQHPYAFTSGHVGSVVKALPAGDYSLEGFEKQVAIERKSLSDFISTVVHDRKRFEAELTTLSGYTYAWVIVECSLDDILSGDYRSAIRPKALLGIATALMTDYIPIVFTENRACAIVLVEALLLRCHKRITKKQSCKTIRKT